ncbi:MAG: Rdx family protein [Candidatus Dormibacteraceae bacterium]
MDEAVRAAAEILGGWAPVIGETILRPVSHGRFEIELDGRRVFDKAVTGRFPDGGELIRLLAADLGSPPPWRS